MASDVLLEIGVEELPASFVKAAVAALPALLEKGLADLRLSHGAVHAAGTPRRLAVWAKDVSENQPDLEDEVVGPPARVAFDTEKKPTRAAESFAQKSGVSLDALFVKSTPKGDYVAARRLEKGAPAATLLGKALERVCAELSFRKSMRWSDGDTAFGRPVRWLVALFGADQLDATFAGYEAGRTTYGHRFLGGTPIVLASASAYVDALRERHVLVDVDERERTMSERLHAAAKAAGGVLIEDAFLVEENASLVEEPNIVTGGFDTTFLALPERVILDVAKGHQRYFGIRDAAGKLLPRYLAVVNTAENPDNVRRGNDRVMRARLSDAKFFYDEDRKNPLAARRPALDGIVFHKRLGTVGDKVRRLERLVPALGASLGLSPGTIAVALEGARLAKCDLVTLMVGELPELQGEMGRSYALLQDVPAAVADVIAEHYLPRGADDASAKSDAGALVAVADRLDTLTGACAVNVMPTGSADPLALRRAAIGILRTVLDRRWDIVSGKAVLLAYAGFDGVKLDVEGLPTAEKLSTFLAHRLRSILGADLPGDVVDACIAAGFDRPLDVADRARALSTIEPAARSSAGEVFKRAANIAKDAPDGPLVAPETVSSEVHLSEKALFIAFSSLKQKLDGDRAEPKASLAAVAAFAPILAKFFEDVFVMVDDAKVKDNRLRLMRDIHRTCSSLANFNLLAKV
jgi:glycyl-tRNA synthetase beta chain